MPEQETIADVDPYGFYSVAATCRILRIQRATLYARMDTVNRDVFGRVPGHEVLRLAGIDWKVERARVPKGDVRKLIKELV